jgi:hypothetical protein
VSFSAGSAYVNIKPSFESFQSDVKAEMVKQGDAAGAAFGDAFDARVKAAFAELPNPKVTADADTTAATAKIDEAARPRTAKVKVEADQSSLSKFSADVKKAVNLQSPVSPLVGAIGLGSIALGPQALGLTAGVAGVGVALGAAAVTAGAFGAIAVPMFKNVSTAQAALTTATTAYNKATTDAGRATALKAEQAALAGLTPAEKQLATELTGLESAWKSLSKAEQPIVGQAISPWLATATSGMQLLTPLIDDGAGAVQFLGTEAQKALQAPFWGTFFNTLGSTGQIALVNFGQAAGSVFDGLAHLFVTFAPDIDQLPPLIDKAAVSFDKWAKTVNDKGLNDFFAKTFSPANLAALKTDLGDVDTFLVNAAKAGGELSPAAFSGLSNVLGIMGKLTPNEIIALTGLFLATKALGGIGSVAGLAKTVIGLFSGGAAQAAEQAAQGTAAGTAAGTSAATAFTKAFSAEVSLALPGIFATIGSEGSGEATAAGTAMGGAAAGGFAEGAGTIAEGLTGVLGGLAEAGVPLANGAGAAIGASFAGGFAESLGGIATAVTGALPEAGGLALFGAALAGGAIGLAFGTGVVGGFGLSGAKNVASGLASDLKNSVSTASTWLQPAGEQAADGFATGFLSQVEAAAAQAKAWSQAGTAGSSAWLAPSGTQAGQGFGTGFASAHAFVNSQAAQARAWVSSALPSPASWLVNEGISVMQGFANGIIGGSGWVISAAESIAGSVVSIIRGALQINSPAKVMFPVGSAVPEGMAVGMLGGVGFIHAAGSALADATVQSLSGVASAQSLGALSALGVPSVSAAPRLPGVSSPLGTGPIQLQLSYAGSGNQLTDALVGSLRAHIQGANGGDVQGVLGQGPVR